MVNWWEDSTVSKIKLKKPLRDDLIMRYIRLFRIVKSRGMPLSKLEIKQFNMEFRRLADLYEVYRRGSTEIVQDPACRPSYERVKNIVDTVRPYTSISETEFKRLLPVSPSLYLLVISLCFRNHSISMWVLICLLFTVTGT